MVGTQEWERERERDCMSKYFVLSQVQLSLWYKFYSFGKSKTWRGLHNSIFYRQDNLRLFKTFKTLFFITKTPQLTLWFMWSETYFENTQTLFLSFNSESLNVILINL